MFGTAIIPILQMGKLTYREIERRKASESWQNQDSNTNCLQRIAMIFDRDLIKSKNYINVCVVV